MRTYYEEHKRLYLTSRPYRLLNQFTSICLIIGLINVADRVFFGNTPQSTYTPPVAQPAPSGTVRSPATSPATSSAPVPSPVTAPKSTSGQALQPGVPTSVEKPALKLTPSQTGPTIIQRDDSNRRITE